MRYSHLDRYVDSLPAGLASFPECQAKSAALLGLRARLLDAGRLPETLRAHLAVGAPEDEWIPEVHVNALMLAVRDHYFGHGDEGLSKFLTWVRVRTLEAFGSPLYRAVFFVLSPELLTRGLFQRWSLFRRGTTLELIGSEANRIDLRLVHPPGLHEPHSRAGLAVSLEAAITAAGGRNSAVTLGEIASGHYEMTASWA
jgi:hypothetical protein